MASLARVLSGVVERPVVDKTEWSGTFDVALTWSADTSSRALATPSEESPTAADGTPGASIFAALQEQLGLKSRWIFPRHFRRLVACVSPPWLTIA